MIYVRWRQGESRRCREFPPLPADNELGEQPCPVCTAPLGHDHPIQLIAVGPDGPEAKAKHDAGRWHTAAAAAVHASCIAGMADEHLDALVGQLVAGSPS